ncbi:hypothetical protein [Tropicimonas sp. IMCC34011]|uniref:spike base protein, RCAP_Rcc01079 family n=1 Tax=Tropicimonas sp. IMCC34011 TaxID=2248759 RepID=UPI000E225086|nr:hypothetical protein [Tropicimonas sp. IMCC34011]
MPNPFANRSLSLSGPAPDIAPVVPADGADLPAIAVALYVETGGTLSVVTVAGESRTIAVGDFSLLPVGIRRVEATGTTASGIHALIHG